MKLFFNILITMNLFKIFEIYELRQIIRNRRDSVFEFYTAMCGSVDPEYTLDPNLKSVANTLCTLDSVKAIKEATKFIKYIDEERRQVFTVESFDLKDVIKSCQGCY